MNIEVEEPKKISTDELMHSRFGPNLAWIQVGMYVRLKKDHYNSEEEIKSELNMTLRSMNRGISEGRISGPQSIPEYEIHLNGSRDDKFSNEIKFEI